MSNIQTIDLDNGKYTVVVDEHNIKTLRYGEPWREHVGDKMFYLLVNLVLEQRDKIAALYAEPIFKCSMAKSELSRFEAEGAFDTEEFGFAQEMACQYGADYIDDDATIFKISAKDLFVMMCVLGLEAGAADPTEHHSKVA